MVRFRPWDPTNLRFGEKHIGSSFIQRKKLQIVKPSFHPLLSAFPAVVACQIRSNDLEKYQNQRYDFLSTFYAEEEGIHGCIGRKIGKPSLLSFFRVLKIPQSSL